MSDPKKLVEYLQTDLRKLSNESKKKYPGVKEAAESCLLKVKNISGHMDVIGRLRTGSNEILHPFLMGCSTRNPQIANISLASIQRILQYKAIDPNGAAVIVNELWSLVEAEVEELKVLQTIQLLVSTPDLVFNATLSKCLVICFRLNFAKDPSVINTASASVRQLVGQVFDRVELSGSSGLVGHSSTPSTPSTASSNNSSSNNNRSIPPKTLTPAGQDAYMLFQDLCLLVSGDSPIWLQGIVSMDRSLGLELLQMVLLSSKTLFLKEKDMGRLVKEQVCPLVIKLFSPNLKPHGHHQSSPPPTSSFSSGSSGSSSLSGAGASERPSFPILMRLLRLLSTLLTNYYTILVTECEIFLSLIIKFLEGDKKAWQRALALEVLHRLTADPQLLRQICLNYDLKPHATKVLQDIINSLGNYVQAAFAMQEQQMLDSDIDGFDGSGSGGGPGGAGGQGGVGGGSTTPGFLYRRVWIPLSFISMQGTPKALFLELMDKHEAPGVADGYCLSLAFAALSDATFSLKKAVVLPTNPQQKPDDVSIQLLRSSYCGILNALSLLLEASTDENITESILTNLQSLLGLGCAVGERGVREGCLGALAKASLPPTYLSRVIPPSSFPSAVPVWYRDGGTGIPNPNQSSGPSPCHVVAVGTPCPTPWLHPTQYNTQVMLTTKNLQAMRSLITVAQIHGGSLEDSWHLLLATLMHLSWILGLRPNLSGGWKTGGGGGGGSSSNPGSGGVSSEGVLTTAVMTDIPVLASMLTKLFQLTNEMDEVSLHHVIGALCKLSSDSLGVASTTNTVKEPSLFPLVKLHHVATLNLRRIQTLWNPITAHLLEVCGQGSGFLREAAASALVQLVTDAFSNGVANDMEPEKLQLLILNPLSELSEVSHSDVRTVQMSCVMSLLQNRGNTFLPSMWPKVIRIIAAVPAPHHSFGENVIKTGYGCLQLLCTDFLPSLSLDCLRQLIEVDAKFGAQQQELNTSLSAVGQLWTISDFLYRLRGKPEGQSSGELDKIWLCLYTSLSELCVDPRPPVRKSACQTLLQTVASHGSIMMTDTWQLMLWNVLFPMLERVRCVYAGASTEKTAVGSGSGDNTANILIHHSRDTEAKQWAETSVQTLASVVRIFNAQRMLLLKLNDFPKCWASLLGYIESSAGSESSEVSLAALKSLLELLIGRQETTTVTTISKEDARRQTEQPGPQLPELPHPQWIAAWKTWLNVGESLCAINVPLGADIANNTPGKADNNKSGTSVHNNTNNSHGNVNSGSAVVGNNGKLIKALRATPQHLTTYLHLFPPIFTNNQFGTRGIPPPAPNSASASVSTAATMKDDWARWTEIMRGVSAYPVASADAPFILPTHAHITPTQEATLHAVELVYNESIVANSELRGTLPQLFSLLLQFIGYAIRAPKAVYVDERSSSNNLGGSGGRNGVGINRTNSSNRRPTTCAEWVVQNYVPFSELCLRKMVEFYSSTAHFTEVIEAGTLTMIVVSLGVPMGLKYDCPAQTTWKLAANSLLTLLRLALPITRQYPKDFKSLWPELANTLEKFLFPKCEIPKNLSSEDERRDEYLDCQVIEVIRSELLPQAGGLPPEFLSRLIQILNRGSLTINTTMPGAWMPGGIGEDGLVVMAGGVVGSVSGGNHQRDVFGLSNTRRREQLSRLCFDSLLAMSQGEPDLVKDAGGGNTTSKFGTGAVLSLLSRSEQVIQSYIELDKEHGGNLMNANTVGGSEMDRAMTDVLTAVNTLINSLKTTNTNNQSQNVEVWERVIGLYPRLIDCIGVRNDDVTRLLAATLRSYQSLLKPPSKSLS